VTCPAGLSPAHGQASGRSSYRIGGDEAAVSRLTLFGAILSSDSQSTKRLPENGASPGWPGRRAAIWPPRARPARSRPPDGCLGQVIDPTDQVLSQRVGGWKRRCARWARQSPDGQDTWGRVICAGGILSGRVPIRIQATQDQTLPSLRSPPAPRLLTTFRRLSPGPLDSSQPPFGSPGPLPSSFRTPPAGPPHLGPWRLLPLRSGPLSLLPFLQRVKHRCMVMSRTVQTGGATLAGMDG